MALSYTPEEIAELNARAADEVKRLGHVSVATQTQLNDMKVGIKNATENLSKSLGALGNSALGLGKSLANGQGGATVFNDAITKSADVLGNLASFIPGVGLAFKVVTKTLIKGAAEYAKAVTEHAENLSKGYKQMAEMGANTADGMSAVYDNLKRMNYDSAKEMGEFTALVRENATTLANFGKTVGSGLTEVAKVSEALTRGDIGLKFAEMGISVNEINKGLMSYTKMQQLYGSRQKMTTEELITASQSYIKEVDALAKITGKNRQEQEQAKETAQAEERYAAYTAKLQARIDAGGEDGAAAKKQLDQAELLQTSLVDTPELRKGVLNAMTGTFNDPATQKFLRSAPEAAAMLSSGVFDASKVLTSTAKSLKDNEKERIARGEIGANDANFIGIREGKKVAALTQGGTLEEKRAQADEDQRVKDAAAKNTAKSEVADRNTRDRAQDLVHKGLVPATSALATMKGAVDSATGALEKLAGVAGVKVNNRGTPPTPPPTSTPAPTPAAPKPAATAPAAAPPPPPLKDGNLETPASIAAAMKTGAVAPAAAPAAAKPAAAKPSAAAPAAAPAAMGNEGNRTPMAPAAAAAPAAMGNEGNRTPMVPAAAPAAAPAPAPIPSGGGTAAPAAPTTGKKVKENKEGKKEKMSMSGTAGKLGNELEKYGITNVLAKRAIVQTAAKESGLNPQAKESGASAYLATLANRGLDYVWKVFPQLKPGGRVAKEKGFEKTGVPASALNEAWSKGDEAFFDYVYGGLGTNSNPGDGYKYRGRGLIGITGRSVYEKVGKEVGKDFVKDPDQVATDFESAAAAAAGYFFMARGGKANALKDLNSMTDPNEALKYALNTVAGLGHKKSDFDKTGSHLQEQFRKASEFGSLANDAVTAETGGVFSGPKSGYPATLHGDEAVIPLNNNSGDFVKIFEDMASSNREIVGMMQEMVRAQRNSVDVQTKILKYAQ
jgi:predicted chitinase